MKIRGVFSGLSPLLPCLLAASLLAACSSNPDKDRSDKPENPFRSNRSDIAGQKNPRSDKELRLEASQLYRRAVASLKENDYGTAIERYNQLIARYPFSDHATQAELEKVYAQYRNYQPDEAVTAADRFLREHPRHPHADYLQYLKGLVNSSRDDAFTDLLPIDSSKKDVTNARRAFDDFALLVQRYPGSVYTGDARKRMVYLRNRVAEHELSVVRFYIKRGAYVAAAKRAENIVTEYPGAPATAEALVLLERSERKIGLTVEADEVAKLIAANQTSITAANAKPTKQVASTAVYSAAPFSTSVEATPPPGPATAAASPERKGWLARAVGAFDFLDTSKPENTYTVVLPSSGDQATPTAQPSTTTAATTTAPGAASSAPTPAAPARTLKLKTSIEYGGDNSEGALPPTGAAAPASPAATPAPATTTAVVAPAKKRGFLERFVDVFSFLDPNRNGSEPQEKPAQPPVPTTVDKTGTTVPANAPGN